jgi:AraC-like DNA-binding protein
MAPIGRLVEGQPGIPATTPRRLGRFNVMYIVTGGGRYRDANGIDRAVRAGDLIIAFPDLPHSYGPEAGGKWDEFYIEFDGPAFRAWRTAGVLDDRQPVLRLEPIDYWLQRFMDVVQPFLAPEYISTIRDGVRLQDVLAEAVETISRGGGGAKTSAHADWLDSAAAVISGSAATAAPVEDWGALAAQLGMGYENFRKKFTRLAGVSPGRFRMRCIIRKACEMLRDPDISIKEVSDRCGFAHPFHFSRQFKLVVGVAPSAFRGRPI